MKKLFLVLLFFLVLPTGTVSAENLQSIINQAEKGTVIKLKDRTYEGNIVITKPLEIVGSKQTIIKGDGTGNVIEVRSPNVTLRQLIVTNSGMDRNSAEEYAGVKLFSNGNALKNLTITDSFHGVYLSQSHKNTLQNITITGLGNNEIAAQGNGFHVYYSNKNKFSKNQIDGTRDGMFFEYSNDNLFEGNTLRHTRYGLHYMYSDQNKFENNLFTLNTGGAAIMNSNHLVLANNQFVFNYGHRSFGLLLLSANNILVKGNLFFLNQRGLYIDQSSNNVMEDNKISKNQIGIELWASSNGQLFTKNEIHHNTIPAVTLGGLGQNSWSKKQRGNDWGSSFPLLDLDQNQIGDEPVTYQSSIYKLMEDQELTYLFLKSPAIKGYEKMNQLLNQEELMFEDPYPLVGEKRRFPWLYTIVGLVSLVIFIKGRALLCFTFGRNGKKI